MARIIVFQHDRTQHPGRLGVTLRDHGFKVDVRRVDVPPAEGGGAIPPDLDDVHGVVSLGGPQSASDPHPWIAREIDFLAEAHARQIPVIGICLGAQLLARALGGEVGPAERPEAGFCPVNILVPGQTETILAGIAWTSHQFQAHRDEIKGPPPESQLLAGSDACAVQCFKAGLRTYGFQYHFEYDRPMIERVVSDQKALFEAAGVTADQVNEQADRHYDAYARLGNRLALNLVNYAFPFHELLAV